MQLICLLMPGGNSCMAQNKLKNSCSGIPVTGTDQLRIGP